MKKKMNLNVADNLRVSTSNKNNTEGWDTQFVMFLGPLQLVSGSPQVWNQRCNFILKEDNFKELQFLKYSVTN